MTNTDPRPHPPWYRLTTATFRRRPFTRFAMAHKCAIDEVTTKINILREEFSQLHHYNPIEHVKDRLKTAGQRPRQGPATRVPTDIHRPR